MAAHAVKTQKTAAVAVVTIIKPFELKKNAAEFRGVFLW